jgi:hypothetical protein
MRLKKIMVKKREPSMMMKTTNGSTSTLETMILMTSAHIHRKYLKTLTVTQKLIKSMKS